MGRRSKANIARIGNLPKPQNTQKTTVEDISEEDDSDYEDDILLEHGFFFLDEEISENEASDDESDEESATDDDVDENELNALKNEADIDRFNSILAHAQAMAVKAEREAAGERPKRKRHYTGNSERTKRHHAQKRRELASTGQKLISSMFMKKSTTVCTREAEKENVIHVLDESDHDGDDESEEDDEIVASLNELFPNQHSVRIIDTCQKPYILMWAMQTADSEVQSAASASPEILEQAPSARERVEELLRQLREGRRPHDDSPDTEADQILNGLCYKDFPSLRRARAKLTVKAKDKKLDVFFRSRITAMVATLNFYLDPQLSYSWRESSVLAAKAMGRGVKHARNLRKWIKNYLHGEKLPFHRYGTYHSSILEDEDFRRGIQLHLMEIAKKGYIRAQDIVDYVATPEVQQQLGTRACGIHVRTARRWLHKLSWRYQQKKKGMYIDGHERDDVVQYRKGFVERWKEYEKRFVIYDRDGKVISTPTGFPVPQGIRFRLILVTHDESTFYETDRRKTQWVHEKTRAVTEKKGEGQSLMASEFLTLEWGRLQNGNECVHRALYYCSPVKLCLLNQ